MLLSLVACISNVLFVTSYVLPESYNIVFKDSGEFKVDESIVASDYEMVQSDQLSGLLLEDKENNLGDLNRLASKDYQITTASIQRLKTRGHALPRRERNADPSKVFLKTKHSKVKRAVIPEDVEPNYDYNKILKEYVEESIEDSKSNQTYHEGFTEKYENELLQSLDKILPIDALNAITQFTKKNATNRNQQSETNVKESRPDTKVLVEKLWRFITILLMVYVILTIPFWCAKGWCCCCLFCKVFNPHKTIAAAKKYLIRNPPGVHSSKGQQKQYEPTEGERDSYEQLEHLIRTM